MKILLFNQSFPMGEFHMKRFEAKYFSDKGHDVYIIQQLNGQPATPEWIDQIKELDPDVMYYGPLDHETYKVVEQFDCKKILNLCSRGILSSFDDYKDKIGKWFNVIYTNSAIMQKKFQDWGVRVEHYEYFLSVITEEDRIYDPQYQHDCVFLGMGFNRLEREDYKSDRELFFGGFGSDIDFKIYGNGWPQTWSHYGGLLPPDKIGTLYNSSLTGMALICPEQRQYGMINNRFSEMGFCQLPIICQNYPEVDWFGADEYLNFVSSNNEAKQLIKDFRDGKNREVLNGKAVNMKLFIHNKHNEFFEKLTNLIEND